MFRFQKLPVCSLSSLSTHSALQTRFSRRMSVKTIRGHETKQNVFKSFLPTGFSRHPLDVVGIQRKGSKGPLCNFFSYRQEISDIVLGKQQRVKTLKILDTNAHSEWSQGNPQQKPWHALNFSLGIGVVFVGVTYALKRQPILKLDNTLAKLWHSKVKEQCPNKSALRTQCVLLEYSK